MANVAAPRERPREREKRLTVMNHSLKSTYLQAVAVHYIAGA